MKTVLALVSLCFGLTSLAKSQTKYECNDLRLKDNYQITIDIAKSNAEFSYNKMTSILELTELHITKKKAIKIYSGMVYSHKLEVVFNLKKSTAALYTTDTNGKITYMGRSFCEQVNPWD